MSTFSGIRLTYDALAHKYGIGLDRDDDHMGCMITMQDAQRLVVFLTKARDVEGVEGIDWDAIPSDRMLGPIKVKPPKGGTDNSMQLHPPV